MSNETKTCQNCKKEFVIEPDNAAFCAHMQVPLPTWCPPCRRLRRMGWTGYRILYKRKCAYSGEDIITFYHPNAPYVIYKQDIWWSDKWDPKSYGRDYDFSKPFFQQFDELLRSVPLPSLHTEYTTLVNSDYCNAVGGLKNCYLVFQSGDGASHIGHENTAYMHMVDDTKDSMDMSFSSNCELCYECVRCFGCFRARWSANCDECHNVAFCQSCIGCSDCVGCVNLKNKSYCIFNEQYSKEEYERKLKELDLGSREGLDRFAVEFAKFAEKMPHRMFYGRHNTSTSGDYISNSKNVHDSYIVHGAENVRYGQLLSAPAANAYDYTLFGTFAEWIYECAWNGLSSNTLKFCFWNYHAHHLDYSLGCHGSENLFGCVGVRKGSYCILNKQYSREEYQELVADIKQQMAEMPYVDRLGRNYSYGEFFPPEISPWTFNESMASLGFLPLSREEALAQGFNWREDDGRQYREPTAPVPASIKDVPEDFSKEILKCEYCGKNYQIIPMELDFYRQWDVPIPLRCPLCREKDRVASLNPMAIYDRECMKCGKSIQTSYAPERKEIVYCETCYQNEVA